MTERTEMEEKTFPDSYVVVDLETTGLSPREDSILEIGAVKVKNGQVAGTLSLIHISEPTRP